TGIFDDDVGQPGACDRQRHRHTVIAVSLEVDRFLGNPLEWPHGDLVVPLIDASTEAPQFRCQRREPIGLLDAHVADVVYAYRAVSEERDDGQGLCLVRHIVEIERAATQLASYRSLEARPFLTPLDTAAHLSQHCRQPCIALP